MRTPKDLTRDELELIAKYAQNGLFLDIVDSQEVWNIDKRVGGDNFIAHMYGILDECRMVPTAEDCLILSNFEEWMVTSNLAKIQAGEISGNKLIQLLHNNGYHRVAHGLQRELRKERP